MEKMRVAVIGGGISGLVSAYVLAKNGVEVDLYEKKDYLGGHSKTVTFDGVDLDPGFMDFNSKKNLFNPYFWQMLREIFKFKNDVIRFQFAVQSGCPSEKVMSFSAYSVLSFFQNHRLLQIFGNPQWLTIKGQSHYFVNKVREKLESGGCRIRAHCEVWKISTSDEGCMVLSGDGLEEVYSRCILAVHAPDALRILAEQATTDELRVLGAFQYVYSMLDILAQCSSENRRNESPFLVTLNPEHQPKQTLFKWSTGHATPSLAASKASLELLHIQGKRGIWFSGEYQGYGFCEDKLKAGIASANGILGERFALLSKPKYTVLSLVETGARQYVTRFLRDYISDGCLILLEEGGTIFTFGKITARCSLKTVLIVHNPQFYWKIMTQAEIGFGDAYVNGDCSFIDNDGGLLHLFEIFIANKDANRSVSNLNKRRSRGWWTPLLFTASISSAKFFLQHIFRQNTVTQARRNISSHYDLSNELFALFLGETMQYSSGIFKSKDEDLDSAQQRKMSILIEKARISKKHEVLDIGCGWGIFAIELVKKTGCKYTGVTLSDKQLKFAQKKVADAGLQDHIRFHLCDYRRLPDTSKFDRIISCEMIEHVGHENMEDFFGCCESVLAEDGIFVLLFIAISDDLYEESRRSSDFIKEYIFPGGCLPSLSRGNISHGCFIKTPCGAPGKYWTSLLHNTQTLDENFLGEPKGSLLIVVFFSKIVALGFDRKFIRTWEYYFDCFAAGFKTHAFNDYQAKSYSFETE
ncbi:hypothetical protein FEM48_Zijuj07G0095200 [Ziziphus jujuba var. spinosa]|uniref:Tuberculostearic acid methyltransferase UfaA1-like n=1 Tax=Ziziphus jujuba var. spinosa TaxID=714518 RepID=A0A978V3V2_ZIZJJ|nr:hypothetical protein FEM48_Zijuj07G0095200 [Ziziphus jujuba var. spinosa]